MAGAAKVMPSAPLHLMLNASKLTFRGPRPYDLPAGAMIFKAETGIFLEKSALSSVFEHLIAGLLG